MGNVALKASVLAVATASTLFVAGLLALVAVRAVGGTL